MKILVCVKQVPDMESRFRTAGSGIWLAEADLAFRTNEYDEFAVEQAVQLRELMGEEADLTVLSVGPGRVVESLKRGLAMGCDRAVHLLDPDAPLKDPWQIASIIADYARDRAYDLIFTGMQSQDRGSAQVGVILAELLGFACTTTLIGFSFADGEISATRELEGGLKGRVKLRLPALVTCQLGLNDPRYPTLPNIVKARKKELVVMPVAELTAEEPRVETLRFYSPEKRGRGTVLEGDVSDLVSRLCEILKQQSMVVR